MAYLNNTVVTVDAILTTKGRELLARNDNSFRITQFSLADDEIDYSMYNPNHPSGSAFYGQAIQNMPLLEAFPQETQTMKYKLVTLPRGTAVLPIIKISQPSIELGQTETGIVTPQTLNYLGNTALKETSGYTFTISDVRLFNIFEGSGINTPAAQNLNTQTTIGTNVSKTVIGTNLNLTATSVNTLFGANAPTGTALYASLSIVGNDSGARITVPVTVTKK
tara:strand:- start:789 stop:1454 length:666 start_codon:yes stop_codon:yes gene_type:complete